MSAIQQAAVTQATTPGNSNYDPYYSNVEVRLTFKSLSYDLGVTPVHTNQALRNKNGSMGTTQLSTLQSKFGGTSVRFFGTGHINVPLSDYTFPGNFTIETWIFPTNVTGTFGIIALGSPGSRGYRVFINNGSLRSIYTNESFVTTSTTFGGALSINTWTHFALVRNSSIITAYLNGTALGTIENNSNIFGNSGSGGVSIGVYPDNVPEENFQGYMDDLRVTKGIARYTTNFVPPNNLLPLYGPQYDDFYNNVSLLLHCNGTNTSTNFIDNSSSPKNVTANGSAQISTAQGKFNGSSAYFAGNLSPGWLSISSDSAFTFGTGDFTIEAWVYLASGAAGTIFDNRTSSTSLHPVIILANGGVGANDRISFYVAGSYPIISDVVPLTGTWTHVALCKSSGSTRLFINGVQSGSTYSDSNNYEASGTVLVGAGLSGANQLNGYINELRISKGVARYTLDFSLVPRSRIFSPFPFFNPFPNTSNTIDPYYDQVTLLLPMNGANASTSFIDSARFSNTVTVNGNTQLSTAQSKFGGSSAYFDGTGDWLSTADGVGYDVGTGNFTVEFWMYANNTQNAYAQMCGQRDVNGLINSDCPWGLVRNNTANNLTFNYFTGSGNSGIATTTNTVFDSQWHHIALVRNGTDFRLYVDGQSDGFFTLPNNFSFSNSTTQFSIGRAGEYHGQYYTGYIDDFRFTKGVARYTSNFTLPVRPNPTTGIQYDNYYDNVSLLLHANGSNNGTSFVDSSLRAKTVTANGNSVTSTTQYKYGVSSAYFDGNNSTFLTVPDSNDFNFGSADFTIEAWVYLTNMAFANAVIVHQNPDTSDSSFAWRVTSGGGLHFQYGFGVGGSAQFTNNSPTTIVANQWFHIAITRSGDQLRHFVNGNASSPETVAGPVLRNSAANITIGRWGSTLFIPFNGYIDEVRITQGIARYTANFTPPTQAFPDQGPRTDPFYYNTSLLLHFDGTNASTNFVDNSPVIKSVTPVGTAQISTAQSKFGGSSVYFNGINAGLTIPANNDFAYGTGDFTLEAWIYTNVVGATGIIGHGDGAGPNLYLYLNGLTPTVFFNGTGVASGPSVTLSVWSHVAVTRSGTSLRVFTNGVSGTPVVNSTSLTNTSLHIGVSSVSTQFFNGHIDDLRITKGVARYVNNFTPPQRPFPNQ